MTPHLFTVGYERRSLSGLVQEISTAGVDLVLDVRLRAHSRKPGFSKNALSFGLKEAGIDYRHDVRLGTPQELLDQFRANGHYDWDAYRAHLATQEAALADAATLAAAASRLCLLCYEIDVQECHRQFVAVELASLTNTPVVHL